MPRRLFILLLTALLCGVGCTPIRTVYDAQGNEIKQDDSPGGEKDLMTTFEKRFEESFKVTKTKDGVPQTTSSKVSSFQRYKIAFTRVSNRRYKNPLAVLKKGLKPYGTDIEDIYTNPVKAVTFNGSATDDMLKITKPDTKTLYYRTNRQDKYAVTVSESQLQKAFTSFGELEKFINSIISAMYSGDEMDEYLLMRNAVADSITEGKMKTISVDYSGDEETSKGLIKLIKTLSANFTFPSKEYNGYNQLNAEAITGGSITPCTTWTPFENQVILIRSDVDASTDVEVLAKAFNMEKTDFLKRKFVVDTFGDADTLCVICDEAMFQFYDDLYKVKSFDNGSNLSTNYWLHHWQTLGLCLYANAVAIQSA